MLTTIITTIITFAVAITIVVNITATIIGARGCVSPVASCWPSGDHATEKTSLVWPFRTNSTIPVFVFHMATVLSFDADASRLQSGLYATQFTTPL